MIKTNLTTVVNDLDDAKADVNDAEDYLKDFEKDSDGSTSMTSSERTKLRSDIEDAESKVKTAETALNTAETKLGEIEIAETKLSTIKTNINDTKEDIKDIKEDTKKISLGFKKAEDNPWEILRRDYPVDTVVESEIVGLTTFGAFATGIPGIDGLIHISQIADRHIASPKEVLSVGEEVTVKITEIDFDKKRVSLSIRALLEPAVEAVEEAAEEAEEVAISLRRALTARNLNNDLDIKNERDRNVYTFKYRGDVYTGFVIFKLDKNTYIFSVKDKDSSTGYKSKKFNLSEIK